MTVFFLMKRNTVLKWINSLVFELPQKIFLQQKAVVFDVFEVNLKCLEKAMTGF